MKTSRKTLERNVDFCSGPGATCAQQTDCEFHRTTACAKHDRVDLFGRAYTISFAVTIRLRWKQRGRYRGCQTGTVRTHAGPVLFSVSPTAAARAPQTDTRKRSPTNHGFREISRATRAAFRADHVIRDLKTRQPTEKRPFVKYRTNGTAASSVFPVNGNVDIRKTLKTGDVTTDTNVSFFPVRT